ncbi:hypothetical protein GCM10010404_19490 [Nonomuraea africana]
MGARRSFELRGLRPEGAIGPREHRLPAVDQAWYTATGKAREMGRAPSVLRLSSGGLDGPQTGMDPVLQLLGAPVAASNFASAA